jgi:hypothetical protein
VCCADHKAGLARQARAVLDDYIRASALESHNEGRRLDGILSGTIRQPIMLTRGVGEKNDLRLTEQQVAAALMSREADSRINLPGVGNERYW